MQNVLITITITIKHYYYVNSIFNSYFTFVQGWKNILKTRGGWGCFTSKIFHNALSAALRATLLMWV